MAKRRDWIEVDLDGLASVAARRGASYVLLELIQNSIDAQASKITVSLTPVNRRPLAELIIEDDGEGFHRLTDAWVIFPPSLKRGNPELRGRFNLGEKLVLARCREAKVETVSGSVAFEATGERRRLRHRLEKGTRFTAQLKLTHAEVDEAVTAAEMIIPPEGCVITVNELKIDRPEFIAETKATLQTEYDDDEGNLRRKNRKTTIKIYRPRGGEQAQLFEMGLPIVELSTHRMQFHVDVNQRIPLDLERSNVPPAYLKQIFKVTVEAVYNDLAAEDTADAWVTYGIEVPGIRKDVLTGVIHKRCGEDAVAFDPSDLESNKIAASKGRTVVPGGTFSREAWKNIKRAGLLPPAGQVTPSPKPFGPGGEQLRLLKEWDENIRKVVSYATWVAEAVGVELTSVMIANDAGWPFQAVYGPQGHLILNRGKLGKAWFDDFPDNREKVTALFLH